MRLIAVPIPITPRANLWPNLADAVPLSLRGFCGGLISIIKQLLNVRVDFPKSMVLGLLRKYINHLNPYGKVYY